MASNKLRCGCNLTLHFMCDPHKDAIDEFIIVSLLKGKFPAMTLDWVTGYGMGFHGFEDPNNITAGDSMEYCFGYNEGVKQGSELFQANCPLDGTIGKVRVNRYLYIYWTTDPSKPLVQECFPELSLQQRELMQTGICEKCWDKMEDL